MPGSIQANTACEPAANRSRISKTFDRMIRERIPNLFRLYVNPHATQACYALTHLIKDAWTAKAGAGDYQVFLANSTEEALSGAIKLARYAANAEGYSPAGLIIDEAGRFDHFASTHVAGHGELSFIPGLEVLRDPVAAAVRLADPDEQLPGLLVVSHALLNTTEAPLWACVYDRKSAEFDSGRGINNGSERGGHRPLLIVVTDRDQLLNSAKPSLTAPDVVVFDESLVNHEVPLGAFAATRQLYQRWNRPGMATFHSTTYQPNTVSTLHLMNCLQEFAPEFIRRHEKALRLIEQDLDFRLALFRNLYSRSLAKLTVAAGFHESEVRTSGHFVTVAGREVFDGVAGVACSVRGHNPAAYVSELDKSDSRELCQEEITARLHDATGLSRNVPAVSGASAVEQALKIGLASQCPRNYVLALRGGFGGKTLFALTGTWKSTLKTGLDPLYPNVVYVDPFAEEAVSAIEAAFRDYPIGVVQVELIQGVGGVRPIPDAVLTSLREMRKQNECLLFIDEVQTGVYRTGPFARSKDVGIKPDLMTIGKGASDMMFPFGMTLYSEAVQKRLDERGCSIPDSLHDRYGYATGLQTFMNTLRRAEDEELGKIVTQRGRLVGELLSDQLADCRFVRDVRCFGLLIGIELDTDRIPHRWLENIACQLYLLAMINHGKFPLLVGFCQYEANVLKLTPPLSVTESEVRSICSTISTVLRRPLGGVAADGLMQTVIGPFARRAAKRLQKGWLK